MRFGQPLWLLLLPVALGAAWYGFRWADRRRERLRCAFTGDPGRVWSGPAPDPRRRRVARILDLGALACLLLALARPLWFVEGPAPELQGVNYLIALDASRSMLARDVLPSRFGAATNALDTWLAEVRRDRVGLMTFAGAAYLNAPLTFDTSALRMVLRYVEPEDLVEGGSSLSTPLERAAKYFQTNQLAQRLVILISDGEELEGDAVETVRRLHEQAHLVVCTVGVGTQAGARIPAERGDRAAGKAREIPGPEITTRLDEGRLRRIAAAGGGQYFPLGPRGEGLAQLRREVLARMAEVASRSDLLHYREMFAIPLVLALGAILGRRLGPWELC